MVEFSDKIKEKRNYLSTLDAYLDPASKPTNSRPNIPHYEQPYNSSKVTIESYVTNQQLSTNWQSMEYGGWRLPATSEPHDWCGKWQQRGCLEVENHQKSGFGRRVFVKQYRRSCYRPKCSICYRQWIIRQANRSTRRIERYAKLSKRKPFHLMLSVSDRDKHAPYVIMKKKLGHIIRELDVYGAAVIFHPFRLKRPHRKEYYYSPHFHLVCYGEIMGRVGYIAKKYGWFIKYLKVRKSVFQTFCYLLSHCGIKKGFRSLIWMGALSYGKLKLEKEPETNLCPCCNVKLVEIYKEGLDPSVPPDQFFEGFVDSDGWCLVKTRTEPSNSFQYSSISELNWVLQSIAEA